MCRKLIPLALATSTAFATDRSYRLRNGWQICRFLNTKPSSLSKVCRLSPQQHSFDGVLKNGTALRSTRNVGTIMNGDVRRLSNILIPSKEKDPNLVLIILNWKLSPVTRRLFDIASLRICADGGANRLYDYCLLWDPDLEPSEARLNYTPDVIKGDLDSIRSDVKAYYIECGVTVVDLSDDQDTTDLQKCINFAMAELQAAGNLDSATFVAVGGLGGRLDHTLSNLNLLHKLPNIRMVLCGDGNLAELIRPGTTIVEVDKSIHGPACGLVALKAPAKVTTKGLTWNCDNLTLEVGGMQSTSNRLQDNEITITTDQPLIWTVELPEDSDDSAPEELSG